MRPAKSEAARLTGSSDPGPLLLPVSMKADLFYGGRKSIRNSLWMSGQGIHQLLSADPAGFVGQVLLSYSDIILT